MCRCTEVKTLAGVSVYTGKDVGRCQCTEVKTLAGVSVYRGKDVGRCVSVHR